MNAFKLHISVVGRRVGIALTALLMLPLISATAAEQRFDVLQIGTRTYQNVTVTTKAKDYIFILHSEGMTNVKVAELPGELKEQLGYDEKQKPVPVGGSAAAWATQKLNKLDLPLVHQLQQKLGNKALPRLHFAGAISPRVLFTVLGAAVLLYLFFSYCCKLICQKAGSEPSGLIWLPALQLLPLLRAAQMSRWWFLAWHVPGLNFVPQILWSVKIVQARAMSGWVTLFLLLPVTTLFAFLYLAFQEAAPEREAPVVEIMTLDTA